MNSDITSSDTTVNFDIASSDTRPADTRPADTRPANSRPADMHATANRPDTRDMIVVHRVFRREFRLLPEMARRTDSGDTARAALVADWAVELIGYLHGHHHHEDEVLWPLLHDRTPIDVDLIRTMEGQHATVSTLLDALEPLAERWRVEPNVANREVFAAAVERVHPPLVAHLALEEARVLPLVEQFLTAAEYDVLGELGRAAIPQHRMMTSLGAMLEEATPEESAMMTHAMPVPAKALWTLVGRRRYAAEMRRLRTGV